ncbi:MAG: IPT/TIG domain-containing protein [Planctomycetes bacterium]|nr:IPT/TIG domain-containing protein [Planctomycetota bacterium]
MNYTKVCGVVTLVFLAMVFSGNFLLADPITITTDSQLPSGIKGNPYSETLTVSGGITPYNWTVVSGTLPSGLALDAASGLIAGTPTVTGTSIFTVKVTSSNRKNATKDLSINIIESGAIDNLFSKMKFQKPDSEGFYGELMMEEEDTTPPSTPTLSAPADGSATNDTTPSFTWNAVTDEDVADYHIEIDTSSAFTSQNKTQLLLHMNESTTFTDSSASAHSVSVLGNTYIDTSITDTWGTFNGCAKFDGTDDYITSTDSADWTMGTGNFTIDFRVRFNSLTDVDLIGQKYDGNNFWRIVYGNWNHKLWIQNYSNTAHTIFVSCAWAPDIDVWYHIAVVRKGTSTNDLMVFINGISQTVTLDYGAWSGAFSEFDAALVIGAGMFGNDLNGWIDELRISKGTARWTSDFSSNLPDSEYEAFEPLVSIASIVPISYTLTSALDEDTYYWRVRARDNAGNYGEFSSAWDFIVDTTAPATPTLYTPYDGQYKTDTTPTLDWDAVTDTDVADYQLQVDTSSAFTSQCQTKLLLHMNSAATFTDSSVSDHSVSVLDNTCIDTSITDTWGTFNGCAKFDGSGDYLTIPDSEDWTWSGDFTIDFWARFDATGSQVIFSHANDSDGYLRLGYDFTGQNWWLVETSTSQTFSDTGISTGAWYHVAVVRSSGVLKVFRDGSQKGSDWSRSTTYDSDSNGLRIGRNYGETEYYFDGWMDELRISKGIARWTSDFTPPTIEYDGNALVSVTGITPTNYTLTDALDEDTYYCRVRARDNAGNYGPYASAYTFTITNTTPSITSLSSSYGLPGDVITITGSSFWPQQWDSKVYLYETPATISSWSDSQIVITIPNMSAVNNYIYVQTDNTYSNFVPFQVGWNLTGGNHSGADWTPADDETVGGAHYNIGTFTVTSVTNITVAPYNGSTGGEFKIYSDIVNIESGGSIDANGAGYGPEQGPGAPIGEGNTGGGTGGSHAAYGGHGYYGSKSPGEPYGNRYEPDTMGSGGSHGQSSAEAGSGGGLLEFWTAGTFTNNGMIYASGSDGSLDTSEEYGGGGGAGGAIFVSAHVVTGTGNMYAYGGSGGNGSNYPGGGGSGGYIAINTASGSYSLSKLYLTGGAGPGDAGDGENGLIGFTHQGKYGSPCQNGCYTGGGSIINVASGNLNIDIDITNIAPVAGSFPQNFSLYYNSNGTGSGGGSAFGPRWNHTFQHKIDVELADKILTWTDGMGRKITFNDDDADTVYESSSVYGAYAVITNTGSSYEVLTKDRTLYTFNSSGSRLLTIEDRNGNSISCTYNAQNRLTNITIPGNRAISLYYNANGKIDTAIDPDGNVTTFTYTAANQLEYIKKGPGYEWQWYFTYKTGTNLIETRTNPLSKVTTYAYDGLGRLIQVTNALSEVKTISSDLYASEAAITEFGATTSSIMGFNIVKDTADSLMDEEGNVVTSTFDAYRNLTSKTDARGYASTFDYDSRGNVVTRTDAAGYKTWYQYDDSANPDLPTRIIDDLNTTTYMEYDANGNMVTLVRALGVTGIEQETDFTYNADGTLASQCIDPSGLAITTTYSYNGYGYMYKKTVDQSGLNLIYESDLNILGYITRTYDYRYQTGKTVYTDYEYDYRGNQTKITAPTRDGATVRIDLEYDKMDRLTKRTEDVGGLAIETTNTYNDVGWLTETALDPAGLNIKTKQEYYDNGLLKKTTHDPQGAEEATVEYEYFDNGWLKKTKRQLTATPTYAETTYTYDANGNRLTVTDPELHVTTSTYDVLNRTLTVTDPESNVTEYHYPSCGCGSADWIEDARNNKTYTYTDELKRVKYVKTPDDTVANKYITVAYVYDKAGRTTQVIGPWYDDGDGDAEGGEYRNPAGTQAIVTRYTEYDKAGRVTETYVKEAGIGTEHSNVEYYYADMSGDKTIHSTRSLVDTGTYLIVANYYDEGGRLEKTALDPTGLNEETYFTYDNLGRQTRVQAAYGDALETDTWYIYNNAGWLTKKRPFANNDTYATEYTYNNRGQVLRIYDAEGLNAGTPYYTENTYDKGGRLTRVTNPLGDYTEYEYDADGLRTKLSYYRDSNKVDTTYAYYDNHLLETTSYSGSTGTNTTTNYYDANGNLTSTTDAMGQTTSFTYDKNNRLTMKQCNTETVQYTLDANSNVLAVDDANTDTDNEYDYLSRLTKVTNNKYSPAKVIDYTYFEDGTRKSMDGPDSGTTDKIEYAYDMAKRLDTVTRNSTQIADYDYNKLGQRTELYFGANKSGSHTHYTYDSAVPTRWLTVVENHTSTATVSSFTYVLDKVGNRTKMTLANGDYVDYDYDNIYQLTSEQKKDSLNNSIYLNTWTYDEVGNRETQTRDSITVTNYAYNNACQLISDTVNSLTNMYDYDANGNMITKTQGANVTSWVYNYNNLVVSYYDPITTNNSTYTWDAMGRRISKTVNGTTEKYMYDGHNIIADYDGSNNLTAQYVTPFLDQNLTISRSGSTYYYMHDGLGSVRNLINTSEIVVNSYDYTAFGETLSATEGVQNRYQFAGREKDSENGSYHSRTRQYFPGIGRFNRRDSIGYSGGINLYSYVRNNPVMYRDPMGLEHITGNEWNVQKGDTLRSIFEWLWRPAIKDGKKDPTGQTEGEYGGDWWFGLKNESDKELAFQEFLKRVRANNPELANYSPDQPLPDESTDKTIDFWSGGDPCYCKEAKRADECRAQKTISRHTAIKEHEKNNDKLTVAFVGSFLTGGATVSFIEALPSDYLSLVNPTPSVGQSVTDYLIALYRIGKENLNAQEDIAFQNAEQKYKECCEACPPKE